MPIASAIELEWGGTLCVPLRCFALPNGRLRVLQQRTGLGPVGLLRKIEETVGGFNAVRETMRQSLVGGGESLDDAESACRNYIDPLLESLLISRATLTAWLAEVSEALEATKVSGKSDTKPDPDGKLEWGSYIAAAGAAGIAQSDFDTMSFADLLYRLDGWRKAHGAEDETEAPTPEDHKALSEEIDRKVARMSARKPH